MEKIKPCPFCGDEKPLLSPPVNDPPDWDGLLDAWQVVCGNEECRASCNGGLTEEEAIRVWNTRVEGK